MKNILTGKNSKLIIYALAAFLELNLLSCASKFYFNQSSVVPAAEGMVKVKKDNNNNYSISVIVNHLAEPDRLQPPKKVYVVWMATNNNG